MLTGAGRVVEAVICDLNFEVLLPRRTDADARNQRSTESACREIYRVFVICLLPAWCLARMR